MSAHRLLRTEEAAEFLGLAPATLETLRTRGGGPLFVKVSERAIRYRLADLEKFIAERVRTSTSDPGPPGPTGDRRGDR